MCSQMSNQFKAICGYNLTCTFLAVVHAGLGMLLIEIYSVYSNFYLLWTNCTFLKCRVN